MLRPRVIPSLLLHQGGLYKTVKFRNPTYVGDPINAVRIFNEKEVDELAVFDIDATVCNQEPNYRLIEKLACECRMPFCYGGGIRNVTQARRIIQLGVEKVALSSALIEVPGLAGEISAVLGRQSVVAVLDVKRKMFGGIEVVTHNGKRRSQVGFLDLLLRFRAEGIGELIINSVDRDGTLSGYDIEILRKARDTVDVPLTALGGAGNMGHIEELVGIFGPIGAAAGSFFVFKGIHRAVLISYPQRSELEALADRVA